MNFSLTEQCFITLLNRASAVIIVMLTLVSAATKVVAASNDDSVAREMGKVTPYEFNGDVRNLPQYTLGAPSQPRPYLHPIRKLPRTKTTAALFYEPSFPSLNINIPLASMPSSTQNFPGLNFADACTGGQCGAGWPPDSNGDVGSNHFIQAINSAYAVYSKTTGSLLASFTENSLWSTGGQNPCNGNSQGDPIVLYDQLAGRWFLTHFAFALDKSNNPVAPFYECIAVSKTSDPVSGGWWLYPLRMDPGDAGTPPIGTLNDYPKFGIWPDCLYMAANGFSGLTFTGTDYASLSRSNLESGAPLTWSLGFINNANAPFTMIPGNLLGFSAGSLPPAGTPNYFVSESNSFTFEVRKFTAGPNCGNGGTLSTPVSVIQAPYSPLPSNTNIVSQPLTSNTLDMIDDRLMQKVQYRNVRGNESLWVVHNVLTSSGKVAPQWAQIDVTGGTIVQTPVQEQIYTPDTTLHRWMGSLAVDKDGNMALGYSTSNSTDFPSIAYSGRLATDPLGNLSQSETQMVTGNGSQTLKISGKFVDRWGDYTAMSIDPADDCTFWYTNQYYSSPTNGSNGNWQTRIGSFKFAQCLKVPGVATKIGLFLSSGEWYLDRNGNGAWDGTPTDSYVLNFGQGVNRAIPVVTGGTGTATIGIYADGTWYLDLNGNGIWDGTPADGLVSFGGGVANAVPVTGDWNGSGTTKIGIYADGVWYLDLNGNGIWDGTPLDARYFFGIGVSNSIPVTGDWTGSGTAKIGIYANGVWYLDLNGNGVWDGTPTDAQYIFGGGVANAVPVTGDWTGSGATKIGIFADGVWYLDSNGNGTWDGAPTDAQYFFGGGLAGAVPVTGKW